MAGPYRKDAIEELRAEAAFERQRAEDLEARIRGTRGRVRMLGFLSMAAVSAVVIHGGWQTLLVIALGALTAEGVTSAARHVRVAFRAAREEARLRDRARPVLPQFGERERQNADEISKLIEEVLEEKKKRLRKILEEK